MNQLKAVCEFTVTPTLKTQKDNKKKHETFSFKRRQKSQYNCLHLLTQMKWVDLSKVNPRTSAMNFFTQWRASCSSALELFHFVQHQNSEEAALESETMIERGVGNKVPFIA